MVMGVEVHRMPSRAVDGGEEKSWKQTPTTPRNVRQKTTRVSLKREDLSVG